MNDPHNGRRHPRFAVQLAAEVKDDSETLSVVTKDMSRGGICVICPKHLPPGSEIQLSLSLVLGAAKFSESLHLSGRVVWCTPVGRGFQVGIAFIRLDHEKVGYLDMYLRFLEQEIQVSERSKPVLSTPTFDTGDADDT
jgi:Tfp pilus assembly protein PilZ